MRTVSNASLAKLSQKTGTEPVCLVELEWSLGAPLLYADKDVGIEGINGRILQIGAFDDVVNISKSGTSQTVNVVLDDTDGAIKEVFNNIDCHWKPARIYQWFSGIPITDKFLLFAGVVTSPVVWKEGDRTLSLTITSKSSDNEVGFSPEEGQFPNLPQGMVGQVWPLVFGQVMKLPLLRIDDIPQNEKKGDAAKASTTTDHGLHDPALDPHLKDQNAQAGYAAQLAQIYFVAYLQASFTAREHGELGELDDISKGKGTFSSLAKQYLAQANKYLLQSQTIKAKATKLQTVLDKQKSYEKPSIGVTNGQLFRQGMSLSVRIGSGVYTGQFIGNQFQIASIQHPAAEFYRGIEDVPVGGDDPALYLDRNAFFWTPAGQQLAAGVLAGDTSHEMEDIRYIVASSIQVDVLIVYAEQTVDGIKQLTIVPPNLYEVFQVVFGTLPITMIDVPYSLSSLVDADGKTLGWSDDLYATVLSPIGPNTVDIIEWLIAEYTGYAIDVASFNSVRNLVAPYPMNFAVRSRPNVLKLIQEIAYQARCIVWLKNNVFYIKYLAVGDTSVAMITEADIIEQTLEVAYTETEDLVTKVKISWKSDYHQKEPDLVILRYHINQYGLHEETKDYFTYNQQQLVEKTGVFWLIRDSNTFKRVTCKVPIRFLNIETLDTVTLAFTHNFIANTPIDCVVEKAELDTNDYTITLTLWVPVRAGEMVRYDFAFPGDLSIQEYWPTQEDIVKENVKSPDVKLPHTTNPAINKQMTGDTANGGSLHVTFRPVTWGTDPSYFADDGNVAPLIDQRIDTTQIVPQLAAKPAGTTSYQLYKSIVKDSPIAVNFPTTSYPAEVTGGGPGFGPYTLDAYTSGIDNPPETVKGAIVLQIAEDDTVPEGTWCIVNKVTWTDDNGKAQLAWYFQVPIWLAPE